MKVMGINGSGRPGGNTSVLVKAVLDGAKEAGARTTLIELADWNIGFCRVCKTCKKDHRCIIPDDMQKFYDLAPQTDVLVIASPIYLDHITANLMTFIQRTYCYVGMNLDSFWPRNSVRAILGITYGASGPHEYDDVNDWMAERLDFYFHIPTVAKFVIPSTSHDRIITKTHPEVVRARQFGRSLR